MQALLEAVRHRRAILFAGAGTSMPVGLPSWRALIDHIAQELNIGSEEAVNEVSHFTLAEYYRLKQGSIGPLRSWMDRNWTIPEDALRHSPIHKLIVELDFPVIYTTNFDRNIEAAFEIYNKPYVKVVNAKDISSIRGNVTQIVKLHGDFENDDSIVIAETDYLDRLSFESPLDIKFRSDAMGNTILFVGYSLSDLNIRFLLHRLWKTWESSGFAKDRPPSYVFMIKSNEIERTVLEQWGIRMLTDRSDDPDHALENFLRSLAEGRSRGPDGT